MTPLKNRNKNICLESKKKKPTVVDSKITTCYYVLYETSNNVIIPITA